MVAFGMFDCTKATFAGSHAAALLLFVCCVGNENDYRLPMTGGPGTFEGVLTFTERTAGYDLDGRIDDECTAVFEVLGAQSDIDCFGCDWAFELTSTELSSDCSELPVVATLQHSEDGAPLFLAGWPGARLPVNRGISRLDSVGQTGLEFAVPLDGEQVTDPYASFRLDGADLAWTYSWDPRTVLGEPELLARCGGLGSMTPDIGLQAGRPVVGDLPCEQGYADVYECHGSAGSPVSISLDVTASVSGLTPTLTILNEYGCYQRPDFGAFECSGGDGDCPFATFTPAVDGPFQVLVRAEPTDDLAQLATCPMGRFGYEIRLGGADATLMDDVPVYETLLDVHAMISVSGMLSGGLNAL